MKYTKKASEQKQLLWSRRYSTMKYTRCRTSPIYTIGAGNIETNFGHVKTTMKMDVLKCKTVDGVLRELHVFALIYNLIRQVMMQAAERQDVPVNRISFIDAMRWLDAAQPGDELGNLVVLPDRPNRYEPRVRKRRPKKYKLMNKPRRQLKQELAA